MLIRIRHVGQPPVEALLLASSQQRIRIVVPGHADTLEFTKVDGSWVSESGLRVEFDAVLAEEAPELRVSPSVRTTAPVNRLM